MRSYLGQSNKPVLPMPAPKGRLNTRVYSLNEGDIVAGPYTSVSSKICVSNLFLYALIDLGATYSYLASMIYDRLEGNR